MPRGPLLVLLGLFCSAFLGWTLATGAYGHSYADYLAEWRAVMRGDDPWQMTPDRPFNAYGPLFNGLAVLAWLHPLAPKLLFAGAWCAFVVWSTTSLWPRSGNLGFPWPLAALCIINPLPWIHVAHFGFFDVLVGLACVGAVHWRLRGREVRAGLSIAAGVLLKFVPLVIVPFIVSGRGQPALRLSIACVAGVLIGVGISALLWGSSTFAPLVFAGERGPTLSVYAILGSSGFALPGWVSLAVLAAFGAALFAWHLGNALEPAWAALVAMLGTLLLYQVGYNNYQMMVLPLAAYWITRHWQRVCSDYRLLAVVVLYFGGVGLTDLLFPLVRRLSPQPIAASFLDAMYLIKFVLGSAFIALLLHRSVAGRSSTLIPASAPGDLHGSQQ